MGRPVYHGKLILSYSGLLCSISERDASRLGEVVGPNGSDPE